MYFTSMIKHGSFNNYFDFANQLITKERAAIQAVRHERSQLIDRGNLSELLVAEYHDEGLTLHQFLTLLNYDITEFRHPNLQSFLCDKIMTNVQFINSLAIGN